MNTVCPPTFTEHTSHNIYKHENTPVAIVKNSFLAFSGDDKVSVKLCAFYAALEDKLSQWIEGDFFEYAKSRYEADPSPRKKYRYTPLELIKEAEAESGSQECLFRVNIKITLKDKNGIVAQKSINHLWDLKNGFLYTPPKNKKSSRKPV